MKTHTQLSALALVAGLCLGSTSVRGASQTWIPTGSGTFFWGTNVSWNPNTGTWPGTNAAAPDEADFRVDLTTNQTVGISKAGGTAAAAKDVIATLSALYVGDTVGTNSFTFTKGGANSSRIHFNNPAGNALFEKRGDGNDSFTPGAFRLVTDLDLVFAGGTGSLTLAAAVNEATAGQTHFVNVSGAGTLLLNHTANADMGGGLRIREATVEFNGDRRLGAVTAGVTLGANGTLRANGTIALDPARAVALGGGGVARFATTASTNVFTVNAAVTNDPSNPALLEIVGPGSVVLAGANTFAGDVVVSGGKLFLTSNHGGTGGIIVSNGAGFGVMAVAAGQAPNLTSVTLGTGGNTSLDFNVNTLAGSLFELAVIQTLTPNGTVTVNIAGSSLATGQQIALVTYGALGGDGIGAFQLGSLPPGVLAHLESGAGQIVLVVDAVVNQITWAGVAGDVWDIGQTANWNSGTATYNEYGPATNRQGDIVLFDDSAATATINLVTNLRPVQANAQNSALSYTLSGAGALIGPGMLTKSGTGTLTVRTTNSFTGGSTLSNGIVQLGNDWALGTGPITLVGGTLSSDGAGPRTISNAVAVVSASTLGDASNPGPLVFTTPLSFAGAGRTVTVNSDATFQSGSGNGRLGQKLGPAALTVRGSNYWTGGATEVRNGLLTLDGNFVFGDALRVMADVDSGTSRTVLTSNSTLLINLAGSNLRIGYESASITNGTNIADIYGTVTFISGSTAGNVQLGSDSRFAQFNLLPGSSITMRNFGLGTQTPADGEQEVNFDGGRVTAIATTTTFIQGLTRVNILGGGLTVDSAGFTLDVNQPLLDGGGNGGLTKLGLGLFRLQGTNTYTGPTVVKEGRLAGKGVIAGPVVVEAAGEISAGPDPVIMTINNTLDLNGTYFVEVSRNSGSAASDRLVGITTFNIAGPLTVTQLGTNALLAGDTFDLFDAATVNGTFTATNLPPLDLGLAWDTTQLYPNGIISIVAQASEPVIDPPVLTGTDITLSGRSGAPNAAFRVLTSTDAAAPLATWTQAGTGNFDGTGAFSVTIPVTAGEGQRFYVVVSP